MRLSVPLERRVCVIFSLGLFAVLFFLVSSVMAAERFQDNRNGTVTDLITGLTWIKNPEIIPQTKGQVLWFQARDVCRSLEYGGVGPDVWRLPDIKELQSIVSEKTSAPRIDPAMNAIAASYWSITQASGSGSNAWAVDFRTGDLETHPKLSLLKPSKLNFRCLHD